MTNLHPVFQQALAPFAPPPMPFTPRVESPDERKVRETNEHALQLQIDRQHQMGRFL